MRYGLSIILPTLSNLALVALLHAAPLVMSRTI